MGNCTQCTIHEEQPNRNDIINTAQAEKIKKLNVLDYSKSLFSSLNNIRLNMKKYGLILEKLSSFDSKESELRITGVDLSEEDQKVVKHLLQYLSTHEDKVNIVKEISTFLLSKEPTKEIAWNQDVYDIIMKYASKEELKEEIPQELRIDINKALQKNISGTIFSMSKFYEPYNLIWHLLINNKEKIDSLLLDEYLVGCSVTVKKEFTTSLILLNMSRHKPIIDGVNPVTGAKDPLTLDEKFFDNLTYKDQVIEGNYFYTDDNVLNVIFKFWNGETKEENIVI